MENGGTQTDIVLLIAAGCMGMLILVVSIILFVVYYQKKVLAQKNNFQRELLSATVEVEEKERERIAKNIHDDLGMKLSVIKLNLSKISRNADNKAITESVTADNLKILDETIQSVRSIAKELVPPTLVKLGYPKAMNELCRQITNTGQLSVSFLPIDTHIQLPEKTGMQLYRISQELLNNIIKHSSATEVVIDLLENETCTRLLIQHNGKGITNTEINKLMSEQKGVGLKSIESRAQMINATVTYGFSDTGLAQTKIEISHARKK